MTLHTVASTHYAHLTVPLHRELARRMGCRFRALSGDHWTKLNAACQGGLVLDADVAPVLDAITDDDLETLKGTCMATDEGCPTCPDWFHRWARECRVHVPRGSVFYNSGVMGWSPEDVEKLRRTVRDFGRPILPMKDQAIVNLAIHRERIVVQKIPMEFNRMFEGPAKLRHFAGGQKHLIEEFVKTISVEKRAVVSAPD